jgi:hypothetical protein
MIFFLLFTLHIFFVLFILFLIFYYNLFFIVNHLKKKIISE